MNFACMTSANVCTKKNVKTSKKISSATKARREFIRSHDFSIQIDPSGKCEIKVTKRGLNGRVKYL